MNIYTGVITFKIDIEAVDKESPPKQEPMTESFDWNKAPIICEINGYRWHLGPEADDEMNWQDANVWCESLGGELPPKGILLQAYLNEDIKPFFKPDWYWSSTEFNAAFAWIQNFSYDYQGNNFKTANYYVRAVRKCPISPLCSGVKI